MTYFLFGAFFAIIVGYLIGSVPVGFLIGKFNGIDIRNYGSGNIGATNVRRVLGRGWGRFCFVMDFLKGLLPVLIVSGLTDAAVQPVEAQYYPALAAVAAVAGHCWPVWLRFEGGKGVATTIGAVTGLAPGCVLVAVIGWLVVFYATRYVSVASLVAAVLFPVSGLLSRLLDLRPVSGATLIALTGLAVLIIVRHRSNIERLLAGTESRFTRSSKTTPSGG